MTQTQQAPPRERILTGTRVRHDPDGPYCHLLDENQQPLCGIELRETRMRKIHMSTDCPRRGCVRCPDCARLA